MAMQALGADRACTHPDREPRCPFLRTSLRPQLALPQAFFDRSLIHLTRRRVNTITVSFLQRPLGLIGPERSKKPLRSGSTTRPWPRNTDRLMGIG